MTATNEPVSENNLDFDRAERIGFGEAVFCLQKSSAQVEQILIKAEQRRAPFLLTRLQPHIFDELSEQFKQLLDYHPQSETAYFLPELVKKANHFTGFKVGIVTAGTSDAWVAWEAQRTLAYNHIETEMFHDVGVAGLWRLLDKKEAIAACNVVITIAGMDAALPSVVGGLVPGIVIAVPTSNGYGVAKGGQTALHSALASCAPGVLVCNIDNGYGAACAAIRASSLVRARPSIAKVS